MTDSELREEFIRMEERQDGSLVVLIQLIEWQGPHSPMGRWIVWKEIPIQPSAVERESLAQEAIKDERYFGLCEECYERNPRGWMHSARLCQTCAERNHGVHH